MDQIDSRLIEAAAELCAQYGNADATVIAKKLAWTISDREQSAFWGGVTMVLLEQERRASL